MVRRFSFFLGLPRQILVLSFSGGVAYMAGTNERPAQCGYDSPPPSSYNPMIRRSLYCNSVLRYEAMQPSISQISNYKNHALPSCKPRAVFITNMLSASRSRCDYLKPFPNLSNLLFNMRLINTETLCPEDFPEDNIPPYAILSHLREPDELDLPMLQSAERETITNRAGYRKVAQAAEVAQKQGLHYIWIDNCCVDRSNHDEILAVFNSLLQLFSASTTCYVYLSDLQEDLHRTTGNPVLDSCEWFSLAWTLQELLVPRECIFFDVNWRRVGERKELSRTISKITGIEESYIRGDASVFTAPISTKMTWVSWRKVTSTEDLAYSVKSLFGINMPLVYGVGVRPYLQLQWEILRRTRDEDLFNWYWDDNVPDQWEFIFAPTPLCFVPRTGAIQCRKHPKWQRNIDKYRDGYSGLMRTLYTGSREEIMELEAYLIPKQYINISMMGTSTRLDTPRSGSTDGDEEGLDQDSSSEGSSGDEVTSVFSYTTVSTLQSSVNPIYINGIKEVVQTLLSQAELEQLYLTAMTSMTRQKSRAHMRGFLKDYGKRLCDETTNEIEKQAAKFVQEFAGRLADEIRGCLVGQKDLQLPSNEEHNKEYLESWFKNLRDSPGEPSIVPQPGALDRSLQDNESEDIDSDLEEENATEFPRIEQVRQFLLSSEALKFHVKSLREWLKAEDGPSQQADNVGIDQRDTEAPILPVETQPARSILDIYSPGAFPVTIASSQDAEDSQPDTLTSSRSPEPRLAQDVPDSTVNHGDVKVVHLLSGLMNFFFHGIAELFFPSVRPAYIRMRWRCVSYS